LLHPLLGIAGLLLAPLFVLGSLEFVGPFEPRRRVQKLRLVAALRVQAAWVGTVTCP
jgi:hypothetical protein